MGFTDMCQMPCITHLIAAIVWAQLRAAGARQQAAADETKEWNYHGWGGSLQRAAPRLGLGRLVPGAVAGAATAGGA